MKISSSILLGAFLIAWAGGYTSAIAEDVPPLLRLAIELEDEGDYPAAALEYRRLSLQVKDPAARTAALGYAGFSYLSAGDFTRADLMADRMEELGVGDTELLPLRAETAYGRKDYAAAGFYLESLEGSAEDDPATRDYALRRQAQLRLRQGDMSAARAALDGLAVTPAEALAALDRYEAGHDKSAALGGTLGIVPGMGYLYSGERANALRCIILNALFIYGMVDTAESENWGAFGVLTFFEFTWYSGSIYGGIDAAHRYNQRRLDEAVKGLGGSMYLAPDTDAFPRFKIGFRF